MPGYHRNEDFTRLYWWQGFPRSDSLKNTHTQHGRNLEQKHTQVLFWSLALEDSSIIWYHHHTAQAYNLWQYRLGQSSFHMHSVVIYHFLIHIFHPPSPHPFQCWRRASRHQIFIGPTLNWGNGGHYSFQNIWNYSSCPIVSGKDCISIIYWKSTITILTTTILIKSKMSHLKMEDFNFVKCLGSRSGLSHVVLDQG